MIGGDGWTVPFRYSFFMAEFDEREIERREKERGSYNLTVTEKLGPCRVSEVLFSKRERETLELVTCVGVQLRNIHV